MLLFLLFTFSCFISCSLLSELRSVLGSLRLSDWFNRPGIIEVGDNFDSLTRGHATQPEELTDINFDREVSKVQKLQKVCNCFRICLIFLSNENDLFLFYKINRRRSGVKKEGRFM